MTKPGHKHLNVSVSIDLFDTFKKQLTKDNKYVSQVIREFMTAYIEDRVIIKRTFNEHERKLYNML